MNISNSFSPNDANSIMNSATSVRPSNTIPAASSHTVPSGDLLPIILPASEFYNLGTGKAVFQLPVAEDTIIDDLLVPSGSVANVQFTYTGPFSRSIGGDISKLEMVLLSIVIGEETIAVQSNTPTLDEFADSNEQYVIILSTTPRLEVPVETTIVFEVSKVSF